MTCQERGDNLIPLYAAGALDPAERDELRRHLAAGCPTCAGALAEAEATMALLPLSLEPVQPSAAAKANLMRRVRTGTPRDVAGTIRPSPFGRVAIAALLALAIGAMGVWAAMSAHQRALRAELADKSNLIARLNGDLKVAKDTLRFMGSPDLRVAELSGTEAQPKAGLRVFWDTRAGTWTVAAHDLKTPAPGKAYELWYITADQRKVPAGMFTPEPDGTAVLRVTLPANLGPVAMAAITEEPEGSSPTSPTMPIHAAGKVVQ